VKIFLYPFAPAAPSITILHVPPKTGFHVAQRICPKKYLFWKTGFYPTKKLFGMAYVKR